MEKRVVDTGEMMRILIVEDEAIVAQRLIRMLENILGRRIDSLRHMEDFYDALAYVHQHPIDLLFLDLNLNGRDGFKILAEASSHAFKTIIVSAHTDFAIRAFEYGVVDFVGKPFSEERLKLAIERVRERGSNENTKYLAVRKSDRIHTIPIPGILYIKGADDYSEIHCNDGSAHLHDKSLNSLQQLLPSAFQRLHRSYLVNMVFVTGLENRTGSMYRVILQNGEKLPLSRKNILFLRNHLHGVATG